MKKSYYLGLILGALCFALTMTRVAAQNSMPQPPVAKKVTHETPINGRTLKDDYFWLREKDNKEVVDYLNAENAYTDSVMASTKPLQEKLYNEMLGRIQQTDKDVPYRYGDYLYYARTEEGKQYPIRCRKRANDPNAKEEILLDLNELAKGHSYLGVGAFAVSDDNNLLAYSTDTTGYRQYTLYVKDLRTGALLPEKIERVGSVLWATDNKTIFYTTEDATTKRSDKFWRHNVGSTDSEVMYNETDELYDVYAGRTRDKQMIFLTSAAKTSTEVRYLRADKPQDALTVVLPRENDHEYSVDFYDGEFYIRTNKSAKNFRVVRAPISDPSEKNWKNFVAHNPKVKIEDTDFFAHYGVVSEWENGLQNLRVIDMKTGKAQRITTPEPVYTIGVNVNREFNTDTLRFAYQSMVTPPSIFDYNMKTKQRTLLKQQPVLGGYDAKNYVSERQWAIARDGTRIPLSIVYRKGIKKDGSAPMLLYGYGSYGVSLSPTFSSNRVSLLDRGAMFVIAHIRGGGELGEDWREAGRMMKKINTFNDFIDSADWLVKNKYTASDRLVIQGGSAGGLLMGAVANMRPDLFKAVVSQVPFVDVMNTMLDASLPLTTSEYTEWGNPNEKPAFDYIIQYSPYDNVAAKNYPNTLVMVSYNDSQVPYWEGAKLVARMRAVKTDKNTLILKANMGAGHGGSSGRYDALHETAFIYAFMLNQMGVKN